jgi:lipopolysaccharide export system permease protein
MIRIKRLYSFVLGTFFPLLLATFSVCLFILLMQFLWQYINDMVGKGVDVGVLAQLFFYAGLTLVPMSLPLAILLASLMTFGNLGEHFELLAMKASGISLLKIMRPLIITVVFIVGISFYFQNNILPQAYTKMSTILLSLRQKSPELNIPEGIFYKEITGYNVYVKHKDPQTGQLFDMMIYDYSKGFENAAVIVADTGKLNMSEDKKNLVLNLYSGEAFENWGNNKNRSATENVPYRRETFTLRRILIPFDANFNMVDESVMGNRDMGKKIPELKHFVDSVKTEIDSISRHSAPYFKERVYANTFKQKTNTTGYRNPFHQGKDSLFSQGFQVYFDSLAIRNQLEYVNKAKSKADNIVSDYEYTSATQLSSIKQVRGHEIQLHKKFTFSVACLLFFFIGAPLGAIIRKGGIGMPVIISVFLFLFYYTIDTLGVKLAKQGVMAVWEGMWLSSLVLAALGVFFTYKAVNDSVIMNPDAWKIFLQRLFGKREVRNYTKKEVIMVSADYAKDIKEMETWNLSATHYLEKHQKFPFYISFWKNGFEDDMLEQLVVSMDATIEDLQNSEENLIIGKLMDYPIIKPIRLGFLNKPVARWICGCLIPIGLLFYFIDIYKQKQVNKDLRVTLKANENLIVELTTFSVHGAPKTHTV